MELPIFAPADLQLNGKSMRHQWDGKEDYYYTDAITDQALGFLEQRDQEKPFFLYAPTRRRTGLCTQSQKILPIIKVAMNWAGMHFVGNDMHA